MRNNIQLFVEYFLGLVYNSIIGKYEVIGVELKKNSWNYFSYNNCSIFNDAYYQLCLVCF